MKNISPTQKTITLSVILVALLIVLSRFNTILGVNFNFRSDLKIFIKIILAGLLVLVINKFYPLEKIKLPKSWEKKLLIIIPTITAILFCVVTFSKQMHFNTYAFDLGIYDWFTWQMSNFNFSIIDPFNHINHYADHFEPIMIIAGFLYHIWDSIYVLLIVESVIIALGFVPIYLLAKDVLKSSTAGYLIGLGYLSFLGLWEAIGYPAHPGTWLATWYAFMLYYAYKKNIKLYFVFLLLALISKESSSIHLVFIGLFIILFFKDYLIGLTTIVSGLAWYVIVIKVIMVRLNNGNPYPHGIFGSFNNDPVFFVKSVFTRPLQVLQKAFDHPDKASTIYLTFGSTGFLAFVSLASVVLVAPFFIERVLSDHPAMKTMSFHYSAPIAPIIFIGAIFSIAQLSKKYKFFNVNLLSLFVLISSVCIMVFTPSYRSPAFELVKKKNYVFTSREILANEALSKIPANSAVIAQDIFVPHISHRDKILLFTGDVPAGYDYIILCKTNEYSTWPVDFSVVQDIIQKLKTEPNVSNYFENDKVIIFKFN